MTGPVWEKVSLECEEVWLGKISRFLCIFRLWVSAEDNTFTLSGSGMWRCPQASELDGPVGAPACHGCLRGLETGLCFPLPLGWEAHVAEPHSIARIKWVVAMPDPGVSLLLSQGGGVSFHIRQHFILVRSPVDRWAWAVMQWWGPGWCSWAGILVPGLKLLAFQASDLLV